MAAEEEGEEEVTKENGLERESLLTCQVKASPRAFSDSSSLAERGKLLRQRSSMRGTRLLTTDTPTPQQNRQHCPIKQSLRSLSQSAWQFSGGRYLPGTHGCL